MPEPAYETFYGQVMADLNSLPPVLLAPHPDEDRTVDQQPKDDRTFEDNTSEPPEELGLDDEQQDGGGRDATDDSEFLLKRHRKVH